MWTNYISATSLDEAVSVLAEYGSCARIIAGGTDILIELERGSRPQVDTLIDITRIPGIDQITLDKDHFSLGPLVTHNHIVTNKKIVSLALPLAQASWEVGAPQIRNRATISGNLITASPANDTITPLMAMDASVELKSTSGLRNIPLSQFYTGLRQTVMRPDELMTNISFPALAENQRGIFLKLGLRRVQAISVINIAIVVTIQDGIIDQPKITLGCVAPVIVHAEAAEKYLQGKSLTPDHIAYAARLASKEIHPIDDIRGTADYRHEMVRVLVRRGLQAIADGKEAKGYPENPAMLWGEKEARFNCKLNSQLLHQVKKPIISEINGARVETKNGYDKTLLRWLREDVGLTGTKEGCAEGECGACTIFLDDAAVMSCMVAAPRAHGAKLKTIEGLAQDEELHPLQQAFIEEGAVQCGYCIPGFLMSGAKLWEEWPQPTSQQIEHSISGNLCRCTGYYKIIQAISRGTG